MLQDISEGDVYIMRGGQMSSTGVTLTELYQQVDGRHLSLLVAGRLSVLSLPHGVPSAPHEFHHQASGGEPEGCAPKGNGCPDFFAAVIIVEPIVLPPSVQAKQFAVGVIWKSHQAVDAHTDRGKGCDSRRHHRPV